MPTQYAPLTAWRVTYSDGTVEVHNAAAGITLAEAEAYWIGKEFTNADEVTFRTGVKVEPIE